AIHRTDAHRITELLDSQSAGRTRHRALRSERQGSRSVHRVASSRKPRSACRLLAGRVPDRAHDRMEPSRLHTYQPSAASIRRVPSKVPRLLADPHRSKTAAAALFLAAATRVLLSTGPARCRGG